MANTYHRLRTRQLLGLVGYLLFGLLAGCAVMRPPLVYVDEEPYGTTAGIWRDRWWNYYEAGVGYTRAEGEISVRPEDLAAYERIIGWRIPELLGAPVARAIASKRLTEEGLLLSAYCFQHAVEQRPKDQYRARTYGVRFLHEYFPHRELGITLYRLGALDEAIRELETSRSQTDSARARYFLNEAMSARLQALDLDTEAPTIAINSPPADSVTRHFAVELSGIARDDHGVVSLIINDTLQDVELAQRELPFTDRVNLEPGVNVIRIETEDLTGKRAETSLTVTADWDGPVIAVSSPVPDEVLVTNVATVRGRVVDETGISSFRLNGIEVPTDGLPGAKEVVFANDVLLQPGLNTIELAAVDTVGNETMSMISVVSGEREPFAARLLPSGPRRIQLAMASERLPIHLAFSSGSAEQLAAAPSASGQQRKPMRIVLADARDAQTTFLEWANIEGRVESPRPVKSIEIDGKPVASAEGTSVGFSSRVRLQQLGENSITVEAVDVDGRSTSKTVRVERKESELASLDLRMAIGVLPCTVEGGVEPTLSNWAYEALISGFLQEERFHIPARGASGFQDVIDELHISAAKLTDPETAPKVGLLVGADALLTVRVRLWRDDELEVVTQLINTEKGVYIHTGIESDTFAKGSGMSFLRNVVREKMHILAHRYAEAFPLRKGRVVDLQDEDVYTNLGKAHGLKACMKFYVYKELGTVTDRVTGKTICTKHGDLSLAAIEMLYENGSRAKVREKEALEKIAIGDSVMTK